jgi:pSer/pThr/pTyr-binding forkhead associated (FHA) protein
VPYHGDTRSPGSTPRERLAYEHSYLPLPPLSKFNSEVSPNMFSAIQKATSKNPSERFKSVLEFFETLEQSQNDEDKTIVMGSENDNSVILATLWVKRGHKQSHTYPVRHGTKVGRREGDIILRDSKVSGLHAKFTSEDGELILWDFASANGTYVNGKKIRQATELKNKDLIKVGDTIFVFNKEIM